MATTYFTLTGTNHYYGKEFLEVGMKVKLVKEPDNEYDKEAIRVEYKGLGKIGYVANSTYTVLGDSVSAGRLYDRIGKKAEGRRESGVRGGAGGDLSGEGGVGEEVN